MIYTIGHYVSYMKGFEDAGDGALYKLGRTEDYEGGCAFRTADDARRAIEELEQEDFYAVFGLDADWETETEPSAAHWWHDLLVDAPILPLVETEKANV